eukprot:5988158-Lingulodinium_polyedra.AAC.1
MVRTPELTVLFTRVTTRNMSRVVSRAVVAICRHTGCKKRTAGGHGIGADLDGYMSLEHVVEVLVEKRLLG